jgi:hypothetical protein
MLLLMRSLRLDARCQKKSFHTVRADTRSSNHDTGEANTDMNDSGKTSKQTIACSDEMTPIPGDIP